MKLFIISIKLCFKSVLLSMSVAICLNSLNNLFLCRIMLHTFFVSYCCLEFSSLFLLTNLVNVQIFLVDSDTFDYEKSKNVELVDQLKAKEKKLIAMAREVEMLRSEILNAEKRINGKSLSSIGYCLFI